MGVLDRLESEARAARQRREAAASTQSHQEADARSRLAPALDRARHYLARLAENLNELDRTVTARYELEDLGTLTDLRQESYKVARDDDRADAVSLLFTCSGKKPIEARIQGHPRAEALTRTLRDARLTCRLSPVSEQVMQLRVEAKVPVRVAFTADVERGAVWIALRNLPAIGEQRYSVVPERIDDELLDALAKLVLREPSPFARLTGSVVDDDQRQDLRRKLARERRWREAELAGGLRKLVFPVAEGLRRLFLRG